MLLQQYAEFIESYRGRDKVMRLVCYSLKCLGGLVSSKKLAEKLKIVCHQISSCRVVLRLFDDIPMLCYNMSYGLGGKEQDRYMQFCGVAVNSLDQLYYPLEHVAWAAELKLIPVKSDIWWTASSACWALSLYFKISKCVRYITILQGVKHTLKEEGPSARLALMEISQIQMNQLLLGTRCLIDLFHAINCLPTGFLWGGKLKQWQIGTLGIVSSIINLYQS